MNFEVGQIWLDGARRKHEVVEIRRGSEKPIGVRYLGDDVSIVKDVCWHRLDGHHENSCSITTQLIQLVNEGENKKFSVGQTWETRDGKRQVRIDRILPDGRLQGIYVKGFVKFQGHDFSMRGMAGVESAIQSGLGHLMSFVGTDTIPAILAAEEYYDADVERELVGCSVPATEHSIQCAYGDDRAYLERLIGEVHPTGIVSIVSDGFDYWDVLCRVVPDLKAKILARNGKVVIRPDSGDPVKIVCGDDAYSEDTPQYKGSIQVLWEIFGGTVNKQGYKELDPHIGLIYGDAITFDRAKEILERLKAIGFASTNIVFGVGSFTYQYNTRDSLGYAIKSTNVVIDGKEKAIFKCPKTDDGTKTSQKGVVSVLKTPNGYEWVDGRSIHNIYTNDLLRTIFCNGSLENMETFEQIRARLKEHG